jgi:hypothetical protein
MSSTNDPRERLEEARAMLHTLMVDKMAGKQYNADGVEIALAIPELMTYIKSLEAQVGEEGGNWLWQHRVDY